jgi:hypothetical protein
MPVIRYGSRLVTRAIATPSGDNPALTSLPSLCSTCSMRQEYCERDFVSGVRTVNSPLHFSALRSCEEITRTVLE